MEGFSGTITDRIIDLYNNRKENNSIDVEEVKTILPSTWFSATDHVKMFIETPMHLIFLGVTKTLGFVLKKIITQVTSYASFHRANHPMEQIRNINVEWVKALPFGSSKNPFGPWVSENLLAYARIFKSVYFSLALLIPEDAECMDDEVTREDILDSVFLLVTAWNATVARLMQRVATEESIEDIERHIKISLR